jgi:hypothetical protein
MGSSRREKRERERRAEKKGDCVTVQRGPEGRNLGLGGWWLDREPTGRTGRSDTVDPLSPKSQRHALVYSIALGQPLACMGVTPKQPNGNISQSSCRSKP